MSEPQATPTPTRGERRRERTRGSLIDAARSLIGEKGVAGLRINEITDLADVALGSFYNHFESKEDLVDAVVAESLEALASAVATQSSPDQDPAELVSIAIRRFVRLAYEDPDFARVVVELNHADAVFVTSVYPYARRALKLGLDAGRFTVPDPEVAVTATAGASLALMRAIVDGRLGPGADAAFAEAALRGFGISREEAAAIAARELPG